MQDLGGADLPTQTPGSAIWADKDPHGTYVVGKAKWAKLTEPTGTVGSSIGYR